LLSYLNVIHENEDKTCVMPTFPTDCKSGTAIKEIIFLFKKHVKMNVIFIEVFMY